MHIWDGAVISGDVVGGVVGTTYVRGIGLIASKTGGVFTYYEYNGHGDVVQLANASGTVTKTYDYDAFGVEKSPVTSDANPFRYCGEYFDKETNTIYLRARYYNPKLGRFTQQDPIGDGLNWYTYCNGNPIGFVDPWGLERIVVAGGYYNESTDYPYVFIDSALKELISYTGNEKTTLLLTLILYTYKDLSIIQEYAKFYNFNVVFFTDVSELNNYINNGSDNNRTNDPITKFRVFAHGYVGSIEFGHGFSLSATDKENLSWTIDKIKQLDANAFKNTDSIFYTCNTGTKRDGTSFAQEWSNITGGKTRAVVDGQTWYGNINSPVWWRMDSWLIHRALRDTAGGYTVPYPAFNKPVASKGVKWQTFKPQSR